MDAAVNCPPPSVWPTAPGNGAGYLKLLQMRNAGFAFPTNYNVLVKIYEWDGVRYRWNSYFNFKTNSPPTASDFI